MSLTIGSADDGATITVRLLPRSSRPGVGGVREGALELRVGAPPVEGRANEAARRLLAKLLGLPRSAVRLTAGASPGPLIPRGEADILMGFEPLETFQVAMEFANRDTRVLCNPRPVYPIGVLGGDTTYPPVEEMLEIMDTHSAGLTIVQATEIAREAGEIRSMNLVMVGAVAGMGLLPLKLDSYRTVMEDLFKGRALEVNREAFEQGRRATETPA